MALIFSLSKVSHKLTLVTAAAATLALACVLIAFTFQDLRLVKRVKAEQVETALSILSENLAYAIERDDLNTVRNLLRTIISEHGVVSAVVIDLSGQELSRYPIVEADLSPKLVNSDDMRFYEREIIAKGHVVGFLKATVSHADVAVRISYMIWYSLMAAMFAMAITLVVAWLVQNIVSQPIGRICQVAKDVLSTENYGLRVPQRTTDEIGQLGQAMNAMLDHIEQKDDKLEKLVNQRTQELQKLAEEFRYRALHDTLTGLPNRALFNEEYDRAVAHAARSGKYFSVMLIDVDDFKQINDTYGHEAGDEVLKTIANRIKSAVRAEDTVCRFGGDEFVLLVQDIDNEQQLELIGKAVFTSLSEEIWCAGRPLKVGMSIGASLYPHHGTEMADLKHNADIAMYRAKDAGKNQLLIYNAVMGHANLKRMMMQNDLKDALAKNELVLDFQPQVNEVTKTVVGCEALVRWHHKTLGDVSPSEFIPYAEEGGSVKQLDYFVLRKTCELIKQWREQFGWALTISVNMSYVHFHSEAIVDVIRSDLDRYDVSPERIIIEITERSILQDPATAHKVISAIRALGVRVALDDFGEGLSSMQFIRNLHVDRVKLDKHFCHSILHDEKQKRIAKGVIALANEMNVEIVAEGLEQHQQISMLKNFGCKVMQGFVYSKPLSQDAFVRWVQQYQADKMLKQDLLAKNKSVPEDALS